KVGTLTPGVRVPTSVGSLTTLDVEADPVAVLPMRLNADALSDLVILKQGGQSALAIAQTAPLATFTVNQTGDQNDANNNDGLCDTDLATAGQQCTLRAAIQQANATAGADSITFTVSSITTSSQLPTVFEAVTIDGGSSRVEIKGSGLVLSPASCTIRGLVINNLASSADGISIFGGNSLIESNYLGTDVAGGSIAGTNSGSGAGVLISGSTNNTIGGTTPAARNVIAGFASGIRIGTAPNNVQGNYIG